MPDGPKNPFLKPHFLIGAAVLAAIGSAIGALVFDQASTVVKDVTAGLPLQVRVIPERASGTAVLTDDESGAPFRLSAVVNGRGYAPDWEAGGLAFMPDWGNGIVMC
ncbi:MAG: hypothetical protein WBB25_03820 [Sulfitobacter sp.]